MPNTTPKHADLGLQLFVWQPEHLALAAADGGLTLESVSINRSNSRARDSATIRGLGRQRARHAPLEV